jgi:hypothetical protein
LRATPYPPFPSDQRAWPSPRPLVAVSDVPAVLAVVCDDGRSGVTGTDRQAGVKPTLEIRVLQSALRGAIATRHGYCSWTVDLAGWVVTLDALERHEFSDRMLEEALSWCLVWLMFPEFRIGLFLA